MSWEQVSAALEEAAAQGVFPGADLLVASGGETVFRHRAGSAALVPERRPLTPEPIFDLASLTKPVCTTTLVMLGVERGLLALDDPAARYLNVLKGPAHHGHEGVIIRDLLGHSAGLVDWKPFYQEAAGRLMHEGPAPGEPRPGRRHMMDLVAREPLAYAPGERAVYSDPGFMILGWVLETVFAEPLDALWENLVRAPLGLDETFFAPVPAATVLSVARAQVERETSGSGDHTLMPLESAAGISPNSPSPPPQAAEYPKNAERPLANAGAEGSSTGVTGVAGHTPKPSTNYIAPVGGAAGEILDSRGRAFPRERFAATESCPWRGRVLAGEVHDENAWIVGGVAGHAGLFGTAGDLHRFLCALRDGLRGRPRGEHGERWSALCREFLTRRGAEPAHARALGWDTPSGPQSSSGHRFTPATPEGPGTVGHLGYAGTSIWWDIAADVWVILLTNRVHPTRENKAIRRFRPRIHDLVRESLGF